MDALALRRTCTVGIIAVFFLSPLPEGFSGEIASARATQKKPIGQRPNFVIVLCDDLGYGDLARYGHKVIQTPHLDLYAKEGLKLTSCYAAHPNCSPSRAGMMTGRTPMRVGIHNWIPMLSPMHVRKREITVATLLRQAGYATCLSGKWHLNDVSTCRASHNPRTMVSTIGSQRRITLYRLTRIRTTSCATASRSASWKDSPHNW